MRLGPMLVAAVVAAACASAAVEEPPGTPEPILASVEERGVRLTIALPAHPIRFGRTWAEVVVESTDARPLDWTSSFCGEVADVSIDVQPAFREGRAWPGQLGAFKERAAMTWATTGVFLPERELPPRGDGLCDGRLGVDTVAAGATLRGRFVWDGSLGFQTGLSPIAPPGPATVVASFALIGPRIGERPPEPDVGQPVAATLDVRVEATAGEPPISPGLAIDAALADPGFAAWVLAGDAEQWTHVSVAIERDTWLIQLIRRKPGDRPETGSLGEVRIGSRGEVMGRRTHVAVPGDCPDPTIC